jgi:hypothetical protein
MAVPVARVNEKRVLRGRLREVSGGVCATAGHKTERGEPGGPPRRFLKSVAAHVAADQSPITVNSTQASPPATPSPDGRLRASDGSATSPSSGPPSPVTKSVMTRTA